MNPNTIRVLIADDHVMFRESLRHVLQTEPGFTVVGEAGNGRELLRVAGTTACDVLLLDLAMPGMSGMEVLQHLADVGLACHVIVLTGGAAQEELMTAVRLGARGILLKDTPIEVLFSAIRDVAAGGHAIRGDQLKVIARSLRQKEPPRPCETLTAREQQILGAVANGATNKVIATLFGMREQTVKNHLSSIYNKTGVSSRLEVALYAVSHELLKEAPSARPSAAAGGTSQNA